MYGKESYGRRTPGGAGASENRRSSYGRKESEDRRVSYGRKESEDRRASYGRRESEDRRASYGRRESYAGRASYGKKANDRKESYSRNETYAGMSDRYEEKEKTEVLSSGYEGQNGESAGYIEGRNAVLEAFRSGKTIDRLLIQDGCQDGPIQSIKREARKYDTIIDFVPKERLDQISETGHHQGVIACAAAYHYAEVEDILAAAREKGEAPFLFLLDNIEDPHNLGAIIRTANLAGAHGVIIPKRRAVGLTATVARASAGALNYTPVARVTNLGSTMEELKKQGIWFVCADMSGEPMYRMDLTGPIGVVIGSEGDGVSRLIREKCDFTASIPMKGDIDSLNASVAAGVLAFEIVRQRDWK